MTHRTDLTDLTDREIMDEAPWLLWSTPLHVYDGPAMYLACRLCVEKHGHDPAAVKDLPRTLAAWARHMREQHPDVKLWA